MKGCKPFSAGAAAVVFFLPLSGQAFECPKHLAGADSAIQALTNRLETKHLAARVVVNDTEISVARTLLTNAKITLLAARTLHGTAKTPSDHARAIAKAYAAKGFALATDRLVRSR
ncbi:MAG: hypothetical protein ACE5GT_12560 [Rhodospirillales bacterium]